MAEHYTAVPGQLAGAGNSGVTAYVSADEVGRAAVALGRVP